jgi:hypothetical protein
MKKFIYVVEDTTAENENSKSELGATLYFSNVDKARNYVKEQLELYIHDYNDGVGEYHDCKVKNSTFKGWAVFKFADGSLQCWDIYKRELL